MSELNDMDTNEISYLNKVFAVKKKMSNLKKVSGLDDKVSKLELKAHQLISLLAVSWAVSVDFVAVKM
ncbi:hypothetical protein H5410_026870 [Solanum commersonii]|uniref:Uncharacterized protein n=1 Tax=Solanum commersonii TaxID=4109 RepID=A0A9J5YYA2_SOLCO|nr:hypothetical protein H5410_026870 [Solanum commersonii]